MNRNLLLGAMLVFVGATNAQNADFRALRENASPQTASPQLVCQVYPYPGPASQQCTNTTAYKTYNVVFNYLNLPAGSYTYTWTAPANKRITSITGCGSSSACQFNFNPIGQDFEETVTLVAHNTSTGQQFTLNSTVEEPAVCNGGGTTGYSFC